VNITGNFSIRIFGNIVSKLLGLITLPIVTRALGPEFFGKYNLVTLIIGYAVIITDFGFVSYGIRGIANGEKKIFEEVMSARLTLSIISMLAALIIVFFIYKENTSFVLIVFLGLFQVLAMGLNVDFYFFGKGKMLIPTISQIIGNIIYVIGVLIFIRKPDDLILVVIFYTLYQFTASIYGWFFLRKEINIKFGFSIKKSFNLTKKTYQLGIAQKIEMIVSLLPVLIITLLLGLYLLGIYTAAILFYTIIILIFQNLMLAATPYFVKLKNLDYKKRNYIIILLILISFFTGIIASVFLYFSAEFVISFLYGEKYVEAISVVKQMCLFLIPIIPVAMLLNNILIYFGYDKAYLKTMIFGLITNVILSVILINNYSLKGAILSLGFTAITFIISSAYYLAKNNKIEYQKLLLSK